MQFVSKLSDSQKVVVHRGRPLVQVPSPVQQRAAPRVRRPRDGRDRDVGERVRQRRRGEAGPRAAGGGRSRGGAQPEADGGVEQRRRECGGAQGGEAPLVGLQAPLGALACRQGRGGLREGGRGCRRRCVCVCACSGAARERAIDTAIVFFFSCKAQNDMPSLPPRNRSKCISPAIFFKRLDLRAIRFTIKPDQTRSTCRSTELNNKSTGGRLKSEVSIRIEAW